MGAAIYALVIRQETGSLGDAVDLARDQLSLIVFDVGGLPLPVDLTGLPPSGLFPVYDELGARIDVPLTPVVISPDPVVAHAAPLAFAFAINPGTQVAHALTLTPTIKRVGILAPAVLHASSSTPAYSLLRSSLLLPAQIAGAAAASRTPIAAGPAGGTISPATIVGAGGTLAAVVRRGTIVRAAGLLSSSASARTPAVAFTGLAFTFKAADARSAPLKAPVFLPNTLTILASILGAHVSGPAPARAMQLLRKPANVVGASSANRTPSGVAGGGPPVGPTSASNAHSAAIAAQLVGNGNRAPTNASSSASTRTPTMLRSAKFLPTNAIAAHAQALGFALSGQRVIAIGSVAACAAGPRGPSTRSALLPGVVVSTCSARQPVVVLVRSNSPAQLNAAALVLVPTVKSPLQLIGAPTIGEQISAQVPAFVGCTNAVLLIQPNVLPAHSLARGGSAIRDLVAAALRIDLGVSDSIDFTEEHDVIQHCQQNAVGLSIDLPLLDREGRPVSLFGVAGVMVWLRSPSGIVKLKTGTVPGEPTRGVVRYTSDAGDLHEHGTWSIQVSASFSDGSSFVSSINQFEVDPNLGPYQPTAVEPRVVAPIEPLQPAISFS